MTAEDVSDWRMYVCAAGHVAIINDVCKIGWAEPLFGETENDALDEETGSIPTE